MTIWSDLVNIYRQRDDIPSELRSASLAQWIVESGRGESRLAREHLNLGGLKFRARMKDFASPVDYTDSAGEPDTYCKFDSLDAFIRGYWHFIESGPYDGWREHSGDAGTYLGHIAQHGYAADQRYLRKVMSVLPEARRLLNDAPVVAGQRERDGEDEDAHTSNAMPSRSATLAPRRMSAKKVCVDPGHGMSNSKRGVFDPGTVHEETPGVSFREADIALKFGLTLKDVLRARGVEVFMTRDDHTDHAPVGDRAENAEAVSCDVLISLHLNAGADGSDKPNGCEVLYRDDADSSLATALRDAVVQASGIKARKTLKRTNLAVLRFDGPAALIELGFLANDRDREALLNPGVRQAICERVADAVA